MRMGRKINVKEANLNTVAVEIQAMKIGAKQMTMGVFRQLEEEDIINWETFELKGVPWGKVNYFWGDCKNADHLHIIWQKGDELRRACVYDNLKKILRVYGSHPLHSIMEEFDIRLESSKKHVRSALFEWIMTAIAVGDFDAIDMYVTIERNYLSAVSTFNISMSGLDKWEVDDREIDDEWNTVSSLISDRNRKASAIAMEYFDGDTISIDDRLADIQKEKEKFIVVRNEYMDYISNHTALYNSLDALKQLFIAV
jgi:hypothetical protein